MNDIVAGDLFRVLGDFFEVLVAIGAYLLYSWLQRAFKRSQQRVLQTRRSSKPDVERHDHTGDNDDWEEQSGQDDAWQDEAREDEARQDEAWRQQFLEALIQVQQASEQGAITTTTRPVPPLASAPAASRSPVQISVSAAATPSALLGTAERVDDARWNTEELREALILQTILAPCPALKRQGSTLLTERVRFL